MKVFEIYTVEDTGKISPTGITFRANKQEHISKEINMEISRLDKPCVVVIKPFKLNLLNK